MTTVTPDQIQTLQSLLPKLNASDAKFASSLLAARQKYGSLTQGQAPWIQKLIDRAKDADKPKETITVGAFTGVVALFAKAKTHLKFPKITLLDNGQKIVLSLQGTGSLFSGSIRITDGGKYPHSLLFGRVSPEGVFTPSPKLGEVQKASLVALLTKFGENPARVAKEFGKLTGNCCFCNASLYGKDGKSVAAGFGPICAAHYGLTTEWETAVLKAGLSGPVTKEVSVSEILKTAPTSKNKAQILAITNDLGEDLYVADGHGSVPPPTNTSENPAPLTDSHGKPIVFKKEDEPAKALFNDILYQKYQELPVDPDKIIASFSTPKATPADLEKMFGVPVEEGVALKETPLKWKFSFPPVTEEGKAFYTSKLFGNWTSGVLKDPSTVVGFESEPTGDGDVTIKAVLKDGSTLPMTKIHDKALVDVHLKTIPVIDPLTQMAGEMTIESVEEHLHKLEQKILNGKSSPAAKDLVTGLKTSGMTLSGEMTAEQAHFMHQKYQDLFSKQHDVLVQLVAEEDAKKAKALLKSEDETAKKTMAYWNDLEKQVVAKEKEEMGAHHPPTLSEKYKEAAQEVVKWDLKLEDMNTVCYLCEKAKAVVISHEFQLCETCAAQL